MGELRLFKKNVLMSDGELQTSLKAKLGSAILRKYENNLGSIDGLDITIKKKENEIEKNKQLIEDFKNRIAKTKAKIKESKKQAKDFSSEYLEKEAKIMLLKRKLLQIEAEVVPIDLTMKKLSSTQDNIKNFNSFKLAIKYDFLSPIVILNGCRIGKNSSEPTTAEEISSGLGHCAMVLIWMAHVAQYKSAKFELAYEGFQSSISVKLSSAETRRVNYPLHMSNTYRNFWETNFDKALKYLLQYLNEIYGHLKIVNSGLKDVNLPHAISDEYLYEVNDCQPLASQHKKISICFNKNYDADWNLAMKYFVENFIHLSKFLNFD